MSVLLVGLVMLSPVRGQGLAESVPDSAIVFFSVRDVPQLRARRSQDRAFPNLNLHRFLQEPGVRAFLREPAAGWNELWQGVNEEFGGLVTHMLDCCTGELVLVFLPAEDGPAAEPEGAFVLAVDGKRTAAQNVLEEILQQASASGGGQRRHDFLDATVVELFTICEREGASQTRSEFLCLTDRHFLFAETLPVAQQLLMGLLREPSGGLAAHPDFQVVRRGAGPAADLFLYLNLPTLLETLQSSAGQNREVRLALKVLEGLGLREVRAVGLAAGCREEEVWGSLCLHAPGPRLGLLAACVTPVGVHPPSSWVPADALNYFWCNLDLRQAWQVANEVLRACSPPGFVKFRNALVVRGPPGEPLLDVERDLIAPLGCGLAWYVRPMAPGTGSAELDSEVVVSLDLQEPGALSATIERLRMQGFPWFADLRPLEFQGQHLYSLWPAQEAPGSSGADPQRAGLAVLSGPGRGHELILATEMSALRGVVLRSTQARAPLAESPRFRQAMEQIPGQPFLLVYSNLREYAQALGEFTRKTGRFPRWAAMGPLLFLSDFNLDPTLYPVDDELLPYLDSAVLFGVNTETGVLLRLSVLTPH